MAWNRSNGGENIPSPQKRKGLRISALAIGGVIGLGVVIAAYCLWPESDSDVIRDGDATETRRIKEVTPAAAPKPEIEPVETNLPLNVKRDHSELTREELLTKVPHWAYSVEDRKRVDPGYAKRHEQFLQRMENCPWKTHADFALATLLFNDGNMGWMPPFNRRFAETFLKSLKTPIIVSHDDPPELQAQKRQLIETKIWLKDQLDDGKDIVAILNDEYNRAKKVSGLRENLKRELRNLEKSAKSVQEVEDYIAAANVMLSQAGAETKFKYSTLRTKVRLAEEAEKKEKENE